MKLTRELLGAVHDKALGCCWYCGIALPPFSDWQVDHQHPRSQGGVDDIDNLVAACRSCNVRKSGRTVNEYRHSLQVKLEHAITTAKEASWEWWAYSPSEVQGRLSDCLQEASQLVVDNPPVFCGEDLHGSPAPIRADVEGEAVQ